MFCIWHMMRVQTQTYTHTCACRCRHMTAGWGLGACQLSDSHKLEISFPAPAVSVAAAGPTRLPLLGTRPDKLHIWRRALSSQPGQRSLDKDHSRLNSACPLHTSAPRKNSHCRAAVLLLRQVCALYQLQGCGTHMIAWLERSSPNPVIAG